MTRCKKWDRLFSSDSTYHQDDGVEVTAQGEAHRPPGQSAQGCCAHLDVFLFDFRI